MVKTGGEEEFKKSAVKITKEIDPNIAFYSFKRKMVEGGRRAGELVDHPLFPGYIFMQAQEVDEYLYQKIKKAKNFYHFLNSNQDIQPLRGKDMEYLSILSKGGEIADISKATFDENDRIQIVEGPLAGFVGNIIKVNRRKMRATVRIDLCGSISTFDLSYELIGKTDSKTKNSNLNKTAVPAENEFKSL